MAIVTANDIPNLHAGTLTMAVARRLAVVVAGLLLTVGASAHVAPSSMSICAVHADAKVTQIEIFDGDPADLASLAPDDPQNAPNTYAVKGVYDQGRHVTVRCHYGTTFDDVVLTTPVSSCRFSGGAAHPMLVCR